MQRENRLSTSPTLTGNEGAQGDSRLVKVVQVSVVLILFALVFATHHRWIFTHFSSDAYFIDSGWLAFLFASRDPLLRNPSGVNDLSFYAHHLSPHIFLFGAPLATLFGLSGIQIFAYHQGFFFGLFFLALYLIVASPGVHPRDRIIATVSAILLGTLSNTLFQAAAYPHTEIAMIAIATLALAGWTRRYRHLFILCLLWLPLIREDGGFYGAAVCLACVAIDWDRKPGANSSTRRLALLAVGGILASTSAFLIKAWFFPGFDAFANNFSGQRWNHVTAAFLSERVQSMLHNLNIVPVLVGCVLLAAFDLRYLTGLVLLSPVYLVHLLAVRPEHGHFTLYFALPFLLPCAIWLAVFVRRSRTTHAAFPEAILILAAAVVLSAPFQFAVGARHQFWYVAMWSFQRPVADIQGMQDFVLKARKRVATAGNDRRPNQTDCISQGIAALIPNDIDADQVLSPDADFGKCRTLVLMQGEMQYGELRTRAEAARFALTSSRDNAELWLAAKRR